MLFYEKGEANYISKFCEGYEYLVAYENTKYELWFMDLFFSSFDLRQSDSITSLELTQHHPHPPKTTKRWVIDWLPFSLFYMCEIKTTPFSPFWLFIRKLFLILPQSFAAKKSSPQLTWLSHMHTMSESHVEIYCRFISWINRET